MFSPLRTLVATLSLRSRAVLAAAGAGGVIFLLLLATVGRGAVGPALLPAVLSAVTIWVFCERAILGVEAAVRRLHAAAEGDLDAPVPPAVLGAAPRLATAMEAMLAGFRDRLGNVQRLAMFDAVTGLPNRLHFRRTVEHQLTGMGAETTAALFFIDLDRFKAVNDTLGHASGDHLLAMIANRLRAVAERFAGPADGAPPPLIGRLAGDEFTLFFPRLDRAGDADRIGRAILFALAEPFDIADEEVTIGASIGIALRPDHGTTLTELMRAADAAMYHAKETGRGRAEHFSAGLAERIADRARLEADLRDAIEREQFGLAFQPQVGLDRGDVVAAEALLRWHHPSGEERLPGSFLPRAEESGLIVEIGEWVIASVADTIRRWAAIGVDHRLAVNVSRRQLDHAHFFRRLRQAMQAAGAPARLLELEITETLAMHCSDEVVDAIAALRADGATIAIDDFGTGYSNPLRLRNLPIDRIKLDRALIEEVAVSPAALSIVQALVGLIHGLGLEAVAEGVESEAQAKVLRIVGCDVVQGYAVAAPMAEAEFLAWSRSSSDRLRA